MTQTHAVAVYVKSACPQCTATKMRLDKNGTAYTTVSLEDDPDALDYAIELGHTRAPIVVLDDGTHWSGFQPDLIDRLKETA